MIYRRYITVLFGGVSLIAGVLLAVAVWLEPYSGDLTRMGGFSENQFGWAGGQIEFSPSLVDPYDPLRTDDVLVLGDSFSSSGVAHARASNGRHWTDHLGALSGAKIGVGVQAALPLDEYLQSTSFRAHPPRFLVVEFVERNIMRITHSSLGGCPLAGSRKVVSVEAHPQTASTRASQRPNFHHTVRTAIDEANDLIVKSALRTVGLGYLKDVRRLALTRSDLFTNDRTNELLVYAIDYQKAGWTETDLQSAVCTLRSWQAAAEANGFTQLLFLIAPDKSTIYRPYLRDPITLPEFIPRLAEQVGDAVLRADLALGEAVAQGRKDVYLPNDTHWGSAGARIAAELVAGRIFVPIPPISAHPSPAAKPPPP